MRRARVLVSLGVAAGAVTAAFACTSSSNAGPGNGGDGGGGGSGSDSPTGNGSDGGATGSDGATITPTNCADAATGPLGLACPDFPGVAPCPNQDMLTDATKFALLQEAMKSGVILHADTPYDSSDSNIYKEKCGLQGFWDPSKATTLVPPATPIPELASLFAPTGDGNGGICASYTGASPTTDGFPAAGTYRFQFHAAYQGETYVIRARATVSGSAAGQSFVAAGISDGGSTYYKGAGELVYQVNGSAAPEATLWTSLVSGFASSTSDFPKVTLAVEPPAGSAPVWSSTIELLCASSTALAAAGTSTIGAQDTIALPGSAGAMAYNAGTKKVYVALTTVSDAGLTIAGGIAVIDDTTNAVTGNVAATNSVVAMGANGTTKKVYASEQTQIDVIDSTADTITTTVAVPSGNAEGFAVDETNDKIYVLGDSSIYVLDGATNTLGGAPYAFTGMTPPTADFTGGKPAIAFDSATQTLYAIGLDPSLNGVVLSVNATTGAINQTYTLTSEQPNAIVFVPGVGAVVSTVSASGGGNAVLVGQTTPGALTFAPSSLALCNTSVNVIGADATGLASFAALLPTSGAIGTASALDATELQENGEVPLGLLATGSSGTSCSFYGSYTYNYNALYSASAASPPAPYVVKFSHQ